MIELEKISNNFKTKKLNENDINSIYDLCNKNIYFFLNINLHSREFTQVQYTEGILVRTPYRARMELRHLCN